MKASLDPKGVASVICGWMVLSVTAAAANDRVYFFHNDHLGTPQAMTDVAGRTVWAAEYEPFGKAVIDQDADGDGRLVVNNLRFPGQYHDAETGLHYNWHRDYDPETGRYLQPDPTGIQAGANHLYAYAAGNPIRFTDPLGLQATEDYSSCCPEEQR
jgi:RHS repeat-associated protein